MSMRCMIHLRHGGLIAVMLTGTAGRPVPKVLVDAGEHAENLYDAAKANMWVTAGRRLESLAADVARLHTVADSGSRTGADRLDREVAALRSSLIRRERHETMVEANQVTLVVANMTGAYEPRVPIAVTRLDFYGRELEIWSEAGAAARLDSAARGVRHEWDGVHSAVSARSPAVARKFDSLVTRVERAESPAEYRRLARQELAEVDDLERVFER
ncbi:MAG: hypothetical protein ABI766_10715 [Gemmatimonadales bacterium]